MHFLDSISYSKAEPIRADSKVGMICVSPMWQHEQKQGLLDTRLGSYRVGHCSPSAPPMGLPVEGSRVWHWCTDCSVEWGSVSVSSVSAPCRSWCRRGQSLQRAGRRTPLKSRWQNQGWRWSRHWGLLWVREKEKAKQFANMRHQWGAHKMAPYHVWCLDHLIHTEHREARVLGPPPPSLSLRSHVPRLWRLSPAPQSEAAPPSSVSHSPCLASSLWLAHAAAC